MHGAIFERDLFAALREDAFARHGSEAAAVHGQALVGGALGEEGDDDQQQAHERDVGDEHGDGAGLAQVDHDADDDDLREGEGDDDVPCASHDLVETQAGNRPADDHHEADHQHDLEHEDADLEQHGEQTHQARAGVAREQRNLGNERQEFEAVAAKEEQDHERAAGDQVRVLGEEEQGETHRGILGVVAAHEFLFGFGVVEGSAVAFGENGDEEDETREGLGEDEPAVRFLEADDAVGTHGADGEQGRHEREAQRDFVRDHLGAGTHAAQEGELVVAGVTAQRDAVDTDAGDGEQIDDAHMDVGTHHVDRAARDGHVDERNGECGDVDDAAPRNKDESHEGGHDDRNGSEAEESLIGVQGRVVFLQHELDAVGETLAQANHAFERRQNRQTKVEPDAVGADAILDVRGDFALKVNEVGAGHENDVNHNENGHRRHEKLSRQP